MSATIAFVMPGIGVVERGAEAFVLDLGRALREDHGFDVTLYCRGAAPLPSRRVRAVARDRPWLQSLYASTRLGKKALDTLFLDPLGVEWATAAISAFPDLWRKRYDIVVMEGGLVGAALARLLRRCRGSRFVDVAHGAELGWEGVFARRRPDRVVVFTRAFAGELAKVAPRARIEVIPHGVDLELFHPGAPPVELDLPRPRVLVAGAIDGHKRLDLTVEALASRERGSLVVLGEGPLAAELDRLAVRRLGRGRYLRTRVPRRELPGWYTAADCFTLASRSEAFGLVYLEAMACGRPVVAPDDPVRREVAGEAAIYFPPGDAAAYGEALETCWKTSWGEIPRRRAEGFPFAATAEAYAGLFAELAA